MRKTNKMIATVLAAMAIGVSLPQSMTYAWKEVHDTQLISVTNKGIADQLQNTVNNLKTLEATLKNLEQLSGSAAGKNMSNIQAALKQLKQVRDEANGLPLDFGRLQENWDGTYTDYKKQNGLSAKDYYEAYEKSSTNVDESIKSAMFAQGLISQLDQDADVLDTLISSSNTADGALKAAQVGNQMTAMLIQNMMRLEQVVSLSSRSQSEYMLKQQQGIEASNAATRGIDIKMDAKMRGKGL